MVSPAVTVGVMSREPIVEAGVRGLLAAYPDRVGVRGATRRDVDVVLYDVLGLHETPGDDLSCAVRRHPGRVLALSRQLQPRLTARALELGAIASVSFDADDAGLLEAIEATAAGHYGDGSATDLENRRLRATQLGLDLELTGREREVIELVVAGCSNVEVAEELFVSINTVKTTIRTAYAKIGVTTRPQAVAWGIEHGFSR